MFSRTRFSREILSGTESTDSPSQEMTERRDDGHNHGQNFIETRRNKPVSKSFILRVHEVLTKDRIENVHPTRENRLWGFLTRFYFREFRR